MKPKILIIDDEIHIVELIRFNLETSGYEVDIAYDGLDGYLKIKENAPQLVLLDWMLPNISGIDMLKKIRNDKSLSDIPVIMLTAKNMESDKIEGLELGADDYIMKPFDAKELVARVKAVLRRYQVGSKPETPQADKGKCVEYPGIEINLTNYSVIVDGHTVEMPPKELELLYFLASSPNQVFTREQLLDQIWGYEYIGDTRTVDVHIKRLREKIKDHNGWSLSTVWGIGYKFEVK